MKSFRSYLPVDLHFGCGVLDDLATTPLPGKKALIVISAGKSMKANGILDRVVTLLKKNGVTSIVFDKIQPNPTKRHVEEGARLVRDQECDFVIGLGGGSSIDSAKAIAVAALYDGDYWDFVAGGSGKGMIPDRALPIIAIPTTAGTGTEADPWTVITKEETQEKIGAGWPVAFPEISLVDPELMVTVPPLLTAYQGFDAFFHAAEGFIASIASPLSDLYALESMHLIYHHLPRAVEDGSNIEARSAVALASTLSGMVETVSCCTSEHSLEHAMSAKVPQLPHGAGLIMISEAYFSFFARSIPERCAQMARGMLGRSDATEHDFLSALAALKKKCHVDALKMSDYGFREEDFAWLDQKARDTMGSLFLLDRVPLTSDDVIEIFRKSYR